MLGVRRTSLTTVAHTLQGAGMISYTRGKIHILDFEGLKESACECYETVKEQYSQLLGSNSDKPRLGLRTSPLSWGHPRLAAAAF